MDIVIGRYLRAGIMGTEPELREDLLEAWEAQQEKEEEKVVVEQDTEQE